MKKKGPPHRRGSRDGCPSFRRCGGPQVDPGLLAPMTPGRAAGPGGGRDAAGLDDVQTRALALALGPLAGGAVVGAGRLVRFGVGA